jgi:hypothetical protein
MQETITYQQQFRNALIKAMTNFAKENPNLERTDPSQSYAVDDALYYARNMKITPMLLWSKVDEIESRQPRIFFLFQNRLSDLLRAILKQYPEHKLNLYFMQEQYELTRQTGAAHSAEVLQLRTQARTMQQQLSDFTNKLTQLNNENIDLKQLNARLSEENLHLKEQLEQVLASSDNHQQVAITLRYNLTDEIHKLRDAERLYKDRIAILAQEKSDLFESCHQLSAENIDLKEKNKRLVEINTRLLKEKMDLGRLFTNQNKKNEEEILSNPMIGFYKK